MYRKWEDLHLKGIIPDFCVWVFMALWRALEAAENVRLEYKEFPASFCTPLPIPTFFCSFPDSSCPKVIALLHKLTQLSPSRVKISCKYLQPETLSVSEKPILFIMYEDIACWCEWPQLDWNEKGKQVYSAPSYMMLPKVKLLLSSRQIVVV